MTGYGEALAAQLSGAPGLCVGIDPHPHLLDAWGLPGSAEGVLEFGLAVVDAAAGRAHALKPQVAFFERYGSAGLAALEQVLAVARERGIRLIGDAKRGDIGTSVAAYGQAWLTPGSPLEVDALTVSAFQGLGSLDTVIELAAEHGKGLYVLCATSNPEAAAVQRAVTAAGESVAAMIARQAAQLNASSVAAGHVGLVLGATNDLADYGLELDAKTPVLAPGFGAQGASLTDVRTLFPTAAPVLASVSRSVLSAGASGLADAIDAAVATVTA